MRTGHLERKARMIECKSEWEIVAFDGRVIQRFLSSGPSEHYHIDHIETVEITTDRKGRKYLRINLKRYGGWRPSPSSELSPEEVPQAQALVDEIQKVIADR
jgi:hypothetical protein